jgi:hypothetical protein
MRRVAVAAALVVAMAACGKGDGKLDASSSTTDEVTTTSTTEEPTTTTATTAPPVTTTAKPVEVREKGCASAPAGEPTPPPDDWATYWQTEPDANQPMTLSICLDDVKPRVGQLITLTVVADDPDASIGTEDCDIAVTWMSNAGNLCRDYMSIGEPQPTPAKEHGHVEKTYTHTYTKAETYLVDVSAASSDFTGKRHPYASSAEASLHLAVHP